MQTLWLNKGEDRRLRAGHLWVFGNEVDGGKSPLAAFAPGEAVSVRDARGGFIGSACGRRWSCVRAFSTSPSIASATARATFCPA